MSFYAAPCKKCPDRRAGDRDHPPCHATCERYLEWRAYKDAELAARVKAAENPVRHYVTAEREKTKKIVRWKNSSISR